MLIIELVPIERRNLGRRHSVKRILNKSESPLYRIISSGCTDVLVDHVSNLSSTMGTTVPILSAFALRHLLFFGIAPAC